MLKEQEPQEEQYFKCNASKLLVNGMNENECRHNVTSVLCEERYFSHLI